MKKGDGQMFMYLVKVVYVYMIVCSVIYNYFENSKYIYLICLGICVYNNLLCVFVIQLQLKNLYFY